MKITPRATLAEGGQPATPLWLPLLPRLHTLRWRLPLLLATIFLGSLLVNGVGLYYVLSLNDLDHWQNRQADVAVLFGGMVLLELLIVGLATYAIDGLILKPLETLRIGAERVGQGDLQHRLHLQRQDEIGRLANAFDQMAARLWERNEALRKVQEELEQRIQERTSALATTNQELHLEVEEHKRAEQRYRELSEALRAAESRYRMLVEGLPIITYSVALDKIGTVLFISPQLRSLGFSPEAWMADPRYWIQYLHPEDVERVDHHFRTAYVDADRSDINYRLFTPDGRLLWIHDQGRVMRNDLGEPLFVQGVMLDITQQKQTEAELQDSLTRIRLIADNLPALIAYVDAQQIYRFANKAFEEWYVNPHIVGKHLREIAGPNSYEGIQQHVESALAGVSVRFEYSRVYPDGHLRHVQISYIPHIGQNEKVIGFFTLVQDLTERKEAEERIKASLEEKNVLLKEIHHRVKNNLQVISSLLYLQAQKFSDRQVRKILQDSQNRVKSMALIHEKLYQTEELAHVNLSEYIRNLTNYLWRLHASQSGNVRLHIAVDNLLMDIDTAMLCGLIINELVSNAFIHAFPNGRSGHIIVNFHIEPDHQLLIRVKDNGVGFPAAIDFRNTASLGLQLVNTLVRQLNGAIEIQRDQGVEFQIRFMKSK